MTPPTTKGLVVEALQQARMRLDADALVSVLDGDDELTRNSRAYLQRADEQVKKAIRVAEIEGQMPECLRIFREVHALIPLGGLSEPFIELVDKLLAAHSEATKP